MGLVLPSSAQAATTRWPKRTSTPQAQAAAGSGARSPGGGAATARTGRSWRRRGPDRCTARRPPPLLVGGSSDAVLEVAARHGDGWHAPSDPDEFATLGGRLDRACERVGRQRPIGRAAQVFLSETGVDGAAAAAERYADAGADALTFVLHGERGPEFVERLGGALRRAGWL
jgi:alkanesulfonate monooxygenase SsuD/methylene tetrahydromethanopterin reductase-like flavin-dependent oxidoreductase (luciferase family)